MGFKIGLRTMSLLIGATMFSCSKTPAREPQTTSTRNQVSIREGTMRGTISEVDNGRFMYQYYDVEEPDSHYKFLEEQGLQGGGYSWEGIIYGLLKLHSPATLAEIEFDAEGDGIAIWSNQRDGLELIARLVAEAKSDSALLSKAIGVAQQDERIE